MDDSLLLFYYGVSMFVTGAIFGFLLQNYISGKKNNDNDDDNENGYY